MCHTLNNASTHEVKEICSMYTVVNAVKKNKDGVKDRELCVYVCLHSY